MSSKFSLPWGVQKPPAVCKKPPIPPQFPPPPFDQQPYQGFCYWNAPAYSFHPALSGPTAFTPTPPALEHQGFVAGILFSIAAAMVQDPLLPALEFEITLLYGGVPLTTLFQQISQPQSLDPFDTGLIQFPVSDPADLVTVRVWT